MPGGPLPLGLVYFAGVKLAGYTAAGHQLNQNCGTSEPHPLAFGAARTAVGVATGIAYGTVTMKLGLTTSMATFYLALFPVRLVEWLFVLWLFYIRRGRARGEWLSYAVWGSSWSYVLDIPAILAVFVLPGGAWIC